MTRVLHFTLGPVQGFIGEARRTRDLWAGSFLLSWLSGQAMAALEKNGGNIVFPQVANDPLFQAIQGTGKGGDAPSVGSLPNRFKADVSAVEGAPGAICRDAVQAAWDKLQNIIWNRFVKDIAGKGQETADIWKRQVTHFWDMAWVVGDDDDGDDGRWLDLRKNWRSHLPHDEPGDKCRLMGHYQELSGHERIAGGGGAQRAFWEALSGVKGIGALDLRADERLCAIALIKRLFPLVASDVLGWKPGGNGMDIRHWPSTSYIAAVPWLKRATAHRVECAAHAQTAKEVLKPGHLGETHTRFFGLPEDRFFRLDGHLLHLDGIRAWPGDELKASRTVLEGTLKAVQNAVGASASEFYAVLLMDGDRIGARIHDDADRVSRGLACFTDKVKAHFDPARGNPHDGVLIYAGGDDVLALLPVDTAISAAQAMHSAFGEAFNDDAEFTLSGAIVLSHYKNPLRAVLREAHRQLDEVAKDRNGRDSLAIAVMKPGGVNLQFVSKWNSPSLEALTAAVASRAEYSSSFFYNLRERHAPLFDSGHRGTGTVLTADQYIMRALIRAEYLKQFTQKEQARKAEAEISAAVVRILDLGRTENGFDFEAPLLVRFLAGELRSPSDDGTRGDH